jgi:hypothetical protein
MNDTEQQENMQKWQARKNTSAEATFAPESS